MKVEQYLKSRALQGAWGLHGCNRNDFRGAIVIPSLAESKNLPQALASLAACPVAELCRFLIVVVINNRIDASDADKSDNQATLRYMPAAREEFPMLHISWVDAASPGFELPTKNGGVGMARKIGSDLALQHLDWCSDDPLLIHLDADTTVQPDYLTAIRTHFKSHLEGGVSIPFCHTSSPDTLGNSAIIRYELFLRSYILGLEFASSRYAFHSIGSAMGSTATAYLKIGGMNCRGAGEDFYFLQQIARVAGVAPLSGTVVHPSPRSSHRVPFGTGRSVSNMLSNGEHSFQFYDYRCFEILKKWLTTVRENQNGHGIDILKKMRQDGPGVEQYFESIDFQNIWGKLRRNNPNPKRFMTAFDDWFDGLKTMKFIHAMTETLYPRVEPQLAVLPLLIRGGINYDGETISDMLETLRRVQLGDDYK